jgi:pimeloyl-ACP methyl ester carboxylesterase
MQPPVIVVPGITASVLEDRYPIEPEEVWTAVLRKNFERITLHPDDLRYEAVEPARVGARNPMPLVYGDLVEALRHDLTKLREKPTPVFAFGYDWRKDCFESAQALESLIDEVLARTRLLPHYRKDPPQQVDLVAHSMGGLIVSAYLRGKQTGRHGFTKGVSRVRRVVTMGTPFRGSVDAVHKLATGMGTLTGPNPRDREREAARLTPALYQLLPTFTGAAKRSEDGSPVGLLDVEDWQPSVLQTLKQFITQVSAEISAEQLFSGFLARAKTLIEAVNSLDLKDKTTLPEGPDGWLPIVGVDTSTLLSVEIESYRRNPWFKLLDAQNEGAGSTQTGDGTVPYLGAKPDFLPAERLVCVTPGDLSMWEVGDTALTKLSGLHGMLPNVNLVQRLAIRHLRDDFDADFWGHPAPDAQKPLQWPKWLKPR